MYDTSVQCSSVELRMTASLVVARVFRKLLLQNSINFELTFLKLFCNDLLLARSVCKYNNNHNDNKIQFLLVQCQQERAHEKQTVIDMMTIKIIGIILRRNRSIGK
jgi:hypothetical protein